MAYQKLKGDHLFDGKNLWGDEKVLVLDLAGNEVDIIPLEEAGDDVEYINGLITPGFVNAHCHLELSHLKNAIDPHTHLVPFLLEVVSKRNFPDEEIHKAIRNAIIEMENRSEARRDYGIIRRRAPRLNAAHPFRRRNSGVFRRHRQAKFTP